MIAHAHPTAVLTLLNAVSLGYIAHYFLAPRPRTWRVR